MEKTSQRAGRAAGLPQEKKSLKKDAAKQAPVKGIGKLSDSPRAKEILSQKKKV